MRDVPLIALVPLKYAGVQIQRGGAFTATFAHARVLKAIKRAADAPVAQYEAAAMTPDPDGAGPETAKPVRSYRRKDLTAKP